MIVRTWNKPVCAINLIFWNDSVLVHYYSSIYAPIHKWLSTLWDEDQDFHNIDTWKNMWGRFSYFQIEQGGGWGKIYQKWISVEKNVRTFETTPYVILVRTALEIHVYIKCKLMVWQLWYREQMLNALWIKESAPPP